VNILRVREERIINFKSSRWRLWTEFARATRVILYKTLQSWGGVGIFDYEDRRKFPIWAEINYITSRSIYISSRLTSKESPTARWIMTNEVRLKSNRQCTPRLMAFRLVETRRRAELVEASCVKCSKAIFSVSHFRTVHLRTVIGWFALLIISGFSQNKWIILVLSLIKHHTPEIDSITTNCMPEVVSDFQYDFKKICYFRTYES
jgi:hypothetical protein